ncbi:MAG: hypothetical protein QG673_2279 [Pseudomonadota bacterium]|nr:hypothetical protein [Pseudomonadota bacterium]
MSVKSIIPVVFLSGVVCSCGLGGTSSTSVPVNQVYCTESGAESSQKCIVFSGGNVYYGFNNMAYALCTKTLCSMTKDAVVATCICPLINESGWQSASLSPTNYMASQPTWNADGNLQTVQSDYSQANFPPPIQQCNFDTPHPYASCFGTRCTVSQNEESAICMCPIEYSNSFNFELESSECNTSGSKIWSAAPLGGTAYDAMQLLYGVLYPDAPVLE